MARVLRQFKKVAADQCGLITFTFGLTVICTMAFQSSLAQQFASFALSKTTGVLVVFQIRLSVSGGRAIVRFQRDAGLFKVVITLRCSTGSGRKAQVKAFDYGLIGDQAAVLHIGRWPAQLGEYGLVVTKYQCVTLLRMLKVVVDTFLPAQTLNIVQVGFVVLDAVITCWIDRAQLKSVGVTLDTMLFKNLRDDLRDGLLLENP